MLTIRTTGTGPTRPSGLSPSPTEPGSRWALDLAPLLLIALSLRNTVPMLDCFFSFDDLQNLAYYLERPWTSLLSNLMVFTSLRRPLGSIPYLLNYWIFGLNPLPLYLFGMAAFYINLLLLWALVRRWFGSSWMGAIAAGIWSLHPHLHNVLYNFGAVYELLACTGILSALHFHSSFRTSGRKRWLALAVIAYLGALNAKETAIALPALVLAHEVLLPGPNSTWHKRILRVSPFFLLSVPYLLAKTMGNEAYWRANPHYRFQFDWTPVNNIAAYLFELTYGRIRFSIGIAFLVIAGVCLVGLILKDRAMLFGLVLAGSTLLPVLFLPRVWGLFLYIPLAGISLCLAALLVQAGSRLAGILPGATSGPIDRAAGPGVRRPDRWRILAHPWLRVGLTLLLIAAVFRPAFRFSVRETRYAREVHYQVRGREWRSFLGQLRELQPQARQDAVFGFVDPPFDPASDDRWCLYFLVWLNYQSRDIQIFRFPEGEADFRRAASGAAQSRIFYWSAGKLS